MTTSTFAVNSTASISGKFIEVPKAIATGKDADGNDVTSADFGVPTAAVRWDVAGAGPGHTSGPGIDGPQWVLEHWSDLHNVFQFLRIEDIAPTSARGCRTSFTWPTPAWSAARPRASRPGFRSANGRIWKMVLDHRPDRRPVAVDLHRG
jgi:hypothetical protein